MSYPWKELLPKDSLSIRRSQQISDVDQEVVTVLYQPIIGVRAFSLYFTLLAEVNRSTTKSTTLLHTELLALLGMDIQALYQARIRLEAIGLLRTYRNTKEEPTYFYELLAPLSSEAFFKDDLLRILLLDQVGKSALQRYQERFSIEKVASDDLEEITQTFAEVFHLPQTTSSRREALAPNRQYLAAGGTTKPIISTKTFQFKRLEQYLQSEFFAIDVLNNALKQAILSLHQVYGTSEEQMAQYLLEVANLDTGRVDAEELISVVSDSYGRKDVPRVKLMDTVERMQEKSLSEKEERQESLTKAGFSSQEVQLILLSEQVSPFVFLTKLKEKKKGNVTSGERKTLVYLNEQYKLPLSVINILLYYSLVIQDHSKLSKEFLETVADNWMQAGIETPEQAIEQTKRFVGQVKAVAEKRTEQRNTRYYGKNVVRKVEQLPDWAKEDRTTGDDQMMTEEEQAIFLEQLKQFREKGSGGVE